MDEYGKALPESKNYNQIGEWAAGTHCIHHNTYDETKYKSLYAYFEKDIKPFIDWFDCEQPVMVTTSTAKYYYDNEQETLMKKSKVKRKLWAAERL